MCVLALDLSNQLDFFSFIGFYFSCSLYFLFSVHDTIHVLLSTLQKSISVISYARSSNKRVTSYFLIYSNPTQYEVRKRALRSLK